MPNTAVKILRLRPSKIPTSGEPGQKWDTQFHYADDRLFHEGLSGRPDRKLVQLGGDAAAIGVGFGGGQPLAQLDDLFFAGATPANLGPAARCGHAVLLI
jgi:hypothetical protein